MLSKASVSVLHRLPPRQVVLIAQVASKNVAIQFTHNYKNRAKVGLTLGKNNKIATRLYSIQERSDFIKNY